MSFFCLKNQVTMQSNCICHYCGDIGNGNRCPYQASSSGAAQAAYSSAGAQQTRLAAAYYAQIAQQAIQTSSTSPGSLFGLGYVIHNLETDKTVPLPVEHAGMTVGEIIGHRIWRVTTSGLLQSYVQETIWPPNEPLHASGKVEDHGILGIWAFKTHQRASQNGHEAATSQYLSGGALAIGSVYLWGDVVEHTDGYRAEWAKVRSIDYVLGG